MRKSATLNNERMKTAIQLAFCLLLVGMTCTRSMAQQAPPFTPMEKKHIRVATPGLFATDKHLYIHLDSLSEGEYCFPLPGGKVISPYGRGGGRHTGTDIKTRANDTIRCAFSGIVRMACVYGAYGNVIVVRHPSGLETIYSHNSKNLVGSGDVVKAGQAIGLTGRTGRATTEHLHFETRINGQHFNPNILFNMEKGTLRHECIRCTKNGNGIVVKPCATAPSAAAQ